MAQAAKRIDEFDTLENPIGNEYLLVQNPTTLGYNKTPISKSGSVKSVNGKTGAVVINQTDVGLSNVNNTSDADKPVSTAQAAANIQDRARANHTGTQPATTITGLATVATSGDYADLLNKPSPANVPDATSSVKGVVKLTNDFGGTADLPTVPALANKLPVSGANKGDIYVDYIGGKTSSAVLFDANATMGGTLTLNGSPANGLHAATKTYVDNAVANGTAADATTTTKGKIKLAGDLKGTADLPRVSNIEASSNLGIGTTTPDDFVHILKTDAASPVTLKVQNNFANGGQDAELLLSLSANQTNTSVGASIYADRTDAVNGGDTDLLLKNSLGSTLNTNVIIKSTGNVGIGKTPTSKLDVNGTTTSTAFAGDGALLTNVDSKSRLYTKTVGSSNADYIVDGTADDVEINAAIVAVNAAGGGTVFLRSGTFTCTGFITLLSNVRIVGNGSSTIIKMANGANVQEFIRANTISYASLENLKVDYNHQNNPTPSRGMWLKAPSSYLTIRDCIFINCRGFAVGFAGEGTGNVSIRNDHCVALNNVVTNIIANNNDMFLMLSDYGLVHGNKVEGITANGGFVLYESDYLTATDNFVSIGNNPAGTGFGVWSMRWGNVSNNTILGTGNSNGIQVLTEHDNAVPVYSQNNKISGNIIKNVSSAFSILESSDDTFSDNKIDNCGKVIDYVNGVAAVRPSFRNNKANNTTTAMGVGIDPINPYYIGNSLGATDYFGVGTLSPSEAAHIVGSDGAAPITLKVQNAFASGGQDTQLFLSTSSNLTNNSIGASLYADRTDTGTAGTTDILLKNSNGSTLNTNVTIKGNTGFVGIGKTPTTALDVNGTITGLNNVSSAATGDAYRATAVTDANYLSGYTGASQFFGVRKRSNHVELQTFNNTPLAINPQGNNTAIGTAVANSMLQIAGSVSLPITTKTANYNVTATDYTILVDATAGSVIINLPTAVGISGRIYVFKKIDASANTVTIDANGTQTIQALGAPALTQDLTAQGTSITIQSDNANWTAY